MPFNINNCQILQVSSRNTRRDNKICGVIIESVHSVKDLGVTVVSTFKFSSSTKSKELKKQRVISLVKRKFSFIDKNVGLPLYSFVRPHLEYAVQFWSPHHVKDIAKLGVHRKASKMISPMRNKSYEQRLSRLICFILKNEDCKENRSSALKYFIVLPKWIRPSCL